MHQQRLAGLEVGDEEDVGPHRADDFRQGRRVDQGHALRHGQQLPGGHPHLLGVPAAGEQRAHLVADRPVVDALTERLDDPAHLEPGDLRLAGRRRVVALALEQVGAVDACGGDPH